MRTTRKCCKCSEHDVHTRYIKEGSRIKVITLTSLDDFKDNAFSHLEQSQDRLSKLEIATIEHLHNTCRCCGYSWNEYTDDTKEKIMNNKLNSSCTKMRGR